MEIEPQQVQILKPQAQKVTEQAYTNYVYVSPNRYHIFQKLTQGKEPIYVIVNGYVFWLEKSDKFADDEVGMNSFQRQVLRIALTGTVNTSVYTPSRDKEYRLSVIKFDLDIKKYEQVSQGKFEVDDQELSAIIKQAFKSQFMLNGQIVLVQYQGNLFSAKVIGQQFLSLGVKEETKVDINQPGLIVDETDIELSAETNPKFKLKSAGMKVQNLFREDFKFENMGIGGLDNELANIFRRAFASRRFPPAALKKYGMKHVKGLLLYGPPGTGKTLIARKLAEALQSKPPIIVNAGEIFSKYVGDSEANVRNLFKDAKADEENLGDESPLHIIVFDEFDAISRSRGSIQSGTGVHEGVVNQLLAMIDGVKSLNNILVIGMTNRLDLIDEAILRPGRFEVHVEINLPDEKGRHDIFKIHTEEMYKNKVIDEKVDLMQLAKQTKNFTGAEIEAVVKSAVSFAQNSVKNIFDFSKKNVLDDIPKVSMQHLQLALEEIKPQFGIDNNRFEVFLRNDIINYGPRFDKLNQVIKNAIEQTKIGKNSQLHSILLEGLAGTGKTAIAAQAALKCGFPFVKLISPENFVGYSENGKIIEMVKIFDNAYKSTLSCIMIDNIERIIEFIDMGPRFSNPILQALLILIKKVPEKKDNRLLIIGTTNCAKTLQELEITKTFNITINVPEIEGEEEIRQILAKYQITQGDDVKIADLVGKIPVKQLLLVLDMVSYNNKVITFDDFKENYEAVRLQHI